ncbi:ORC ubiquitin ligase 1-like [Acipenser ruthenus]|uniref:ORC ubiquitin ligase 1-like n=1 Tax=Acipenser ruthenus TaxID=7906 RepID=UPI0027425E7D|nr:ORC ubiquitin ligase 1-like [Acipenser ruthenus]
MSQNIQSVTLSLTLPISCQICLGKVRHPVICANNHVFCSTCIEVWLKRNSQCPTCRVPITPENPCREIIGATNENDGDDSRTVRKHLRKTRLELLLREFEDEIESLQKENEELRSKNLSLESQLQTVLDPSALLLFNKNEDCKQNGEDKRFDPDMVKEWREKLKVVTDIYERVKTDGAKLKEENKNLRSQNIDLVRENLRLKAEVDSRSPQKFGRCTVAALEAEIDQYERDVSHLRKALERSDKYIEELEAQTSSVRRETDGKENMGGPSKTLNPNFSDSEDEEVEYNQECSVAWDGQNENEPNLTVSLRLSEIEQPSVSKLQGNGSLCSDQPSSNCTAVDMSNEKLDGARTLLLTTAGNSNNPGVVHGKRKGSEDGTPKKEKSESEFDHIVFTPSTSFSCLSLNSPSEQGRKNTGSKPLFYLRKLSFDDPSCSSMPGESNTTADKPHSGSCTPREKRATDSSACHTGPKTRNKDRCTPPGDATTAGHITMAQNSGRTFQLISDFEVNHLRTSSEASMDAAYLDKISELDTMISESESSRGSHYSLMSTQSSDLDITLIPELTGCVELMNETDRRLEPKVRRRPHVASCSQENREIRGGETVAMSNCTSVTTDLKQELCLFGEEDTQVSGLQTKQDFLQLDELSPDFFADSQGLSGNPKPGSSHSPHSVEAQLDQAENHSLFLCTALASEKGKHIGSKISSALPIKRKTRSGLDMASPSKASKLL